MKIRTIAPLFAVAAVAATGVLVAPFASPALAQGGTARSFDIAGFDRIDMAGCDEAVVTIGDRFSVRATGTARDVDLMRIDRSGNTLRIRRTSRGCDGRQQAVRVAVTMPALRAVDVSGAGAVEVPALAQPRFDASMSGAGRLAIAGLRGQAAHLSMSGAGAAVLDGVRLDRLEIEQSGAGSIRASGSAATLTIDASGAGQIDTRALSVTDLTVDSSGAGAVRARASDSAGIGASGIARVAVEGGPRCTIRKSGMARVTCG